MNVAVVHPYPVHAGAVGGVTRVYELVRHLARRHRVSVFTHAVAGAPSRDEALAAMGVAQHAFARPGATVAGKLRDLLGRQPYYVRHNGNGDLAAALAAADAREPFDVVHLELGYMQPALAAIGSRAVRVLAEQEAMPFVIDGLRRIAWRQRTRYERLAVFTAAKVDRFDRTTLPAFDLLYGITPRERDYLSRASGRAAGLLPHIVPARRFEAVDPRDGGPATVLFVGNYAHRPNVHAVQWFVEQVWPLVRASAPQAVFHVVGGGLPADMRQRLEVPGVVLRGYESDLVGCYRAATVVVTPIHSGGGMRGKVLEACAAARAIVATPTAIDGIAFEPDRHGTVAGEPRAFAAAVAGYLGDAARRAAHGAAARQLVRTHYDAPVVFTGLEHDYEAAVAARAPLARPRARRPVA